MFYYHWIHASAGGLLVPGCIIRPVVSASALCGLLWVNGQFLDSVLYWNSAISDFGYPVYIVCLIWSQTFKLFGFPVLWLWAYMMKVIPETCRVHLIGYLCFYYTHFLYVVWLY